MYYKHVLLENVNYQVCLTQSNLFHVSFKQPRALEGCTLLETTETQGTEPSWSVTEVTVPLA